MILLVYIVPIVLAIIVAATVAWADAATQYRRTLLHLLAVIVGQRLPLIEGLRAAAASEQRRLRDTLVRLAHHLDLGAPLHASLRLADRRFPPDALDAIDAAERMGTLPAVLRSLARDFRSRTSDPDEIPFISPYLIIMSIAFIGVSVPLCIFILPQFNTIGADFGVSNLGTSGLSGGVTSFVVKYAALMISLTCIMTLLVIQFSLLRRRIFALSRRDSTIIALVDLTTWAIPGFRSVAESNALIRQLPILIASVEAGSDLPIAARAAALVDANRNAQQRLIRWAREIEAGGDALAAARRLGFPKSLLTALEAGIRSGELSSAFDYLLSYCRSAQVHWRRLIQAILIPVMTLGAAVITTAILWMVYGAMIRLTSAVMDSM